ncbi:SH3 domain-containing protein [Thioalkalivibrio paradoxus]|uniref:SH3b domain-containing protein n=1 Tax=Thioalkalivibrio paradoxus ARh 1 TaxID=713585 RepID=W0DNZ2_9GAMM|nr:SH3 domain-containing protein [Thioalkalivibrio paradoxus]AHF00320.1 hypothetical protein THITH_16885 [Thioalkalivibrio paradoxus ARh 1]
MTTEYVYHWNRIVGALAALVLVIGLVGLAIGAWLASPAAPPEDARFQDDRDPVVVLEMTAGSSTQRGEEPAPGEPEPDVPPVVAAPAPLATIPPADDRIRNGATLRDTVEDERSQVFLAPGTRVNLRAEPSVTSPVLRILDADVELRLLEIGDDFYRVRTADAIVGWVSRDFSSRRPHAAPVP